MTEERIARINELAKKSKTVGLTDAEIEERSVLRKEYLASIRGSLEAQLEQVYVTDANGNAQKITKKK
ncbi:MAG: DUF896 domain-containing protein [Evtepia sp.]